MSDEVNDLVMEFHRLGLLSETEASIMLNPTVTDHAGHVHENPDLSYLDWEL